MSSERKQFILGDVSLELNIFIDGNQNPWFRAMEIAEFLGYVNSRKAIIDNVHELNKCILNKLVIDGSCELPFNWKPYNIFINEPGLHQLMTKSKLTILEVFQNWLMYDVLPSLRKIGKEAEEDCDSKNDEDGIVWEQYMKLKDDAYREDMKIKDNAYRDDMRRKDYMFMYVIKKWLKE